MKIYIKIRNILIIRKIFKLKLQLHKFELDKKKKDR